MADQEQERAAILQAREKLEPFLTQASVVSEETLQVAIDAMRGRIQENPPRHPLEDRTIAGDASVYDQALAALESDLLPSYQAADQIFNTELDGSGIASVEELGRRIRENHPAQTSADIAARRYQQQLLESERARIVSENRWTLGIWHDYFQNYRSNPDAFDFAATATELQSKGWTGATEEQLQNLFSAAIGIESKIIAAEGDVAQVDSARLSEIEGEFSSLQTLIGSTTVAETQVLYGRLWMRYQSLRRLWTSVIDLESVKDAKEVLDPDDYNDYRKFMSALLGLRDLSTKLMGDGKYISSGANSAQRKLINKWLGTVEEHIWILEHPSVAEVIDVDKLREIYVKAVEEAEIFLGNQTDELEEVFIEDINWWMFQHHGEQWRATQRLWAKYHPNHVAALSNADRIEINELLEYFSTQIGRVNEFNIGFAAGDDPDVAAHHRFVAMDIQRNKLSEMKTAAGAPVVEVVPEEPDEPDETEDDAPTISGKGFQPPHHKEKPAHATEKDWIKWYLDEFDYVREKHGEEEAMRLIVEECNRHTLDYLQSYAGGNYKDLSYGGLSKTLQDFGKSEGRRQRAHDNFSPENRLFLYNKFLELSNIFMIEDMCQKHGDRNTMLIQWEDVAKYEQTRQGGTEDFSFEQTTDWFMKPDKKEGTEVRYQYDQITSWVLHSVPTWRREFELMDPDIREEKFGLTDHNSWWNDRDAKPWRQAFELFIMEKINDMIAKIPEGGTYTEADIPIGLTGRKKSMEFSGVDVDGFDEGYQEVYRKIIGRLATFTGSGNEHYAIPYCKGMTPSDSVQPFKHLFAGASPYAHFNYKAYKNLTIIPTSEGYELMWEDDVKTDEKKSKIVDSALLTRALIRKAAVERPRINVGRFPTESQLKAGEQNELRTGYPTLYEFMVIKHKEREKLPVDLSTWWGGFDAYRNFTDAIIRPPGISGSFANKEELDNILTGMTPEGLRKAMMKDFTNILKNLVSPLKINQDWVDWTFISQDILTYIDKMFRLYRLKDDSPEGATELLVAIRSRIKANATNLGVKNQTIDDSRAPKETIAFEHVTHDVSSDLLGTGKMYRGKKRKDKDYDVRDYILNRAAYAYAGNWMLEKIWQNVEPSAVPDSKMRKKTNAELAAEAALAGDASTLKQEVYVQVEKRSRTKLSNAEKRIFAKSRKGLFQLLESPKEVLGFAILNLTKEDDIHPFMEDSAFIWGMPSDEQKRDPKEKAEA